MATKNPFVLVFLIAVITIINYFDRTALSYTILPIESDLGLNNAQFGTVAGTFGIGYLVMTFFAGIIIDRFGSVIVWGISAIIWSAITMLMGAATGFWSLSGLFILLGIAEGFNSPALLRTISEWLHPKWRARALSFSLSGVPIASLIGAPFITSLLGQLGWRGMFVIVGTLGIIWAIFWFLFFREKISPPHPAPKRTKTPWNELFTHPAFRANAFSFFTFGCVVFFVIIWLPGYLEQTYFVPIRDTGILVMAPWLTAFILQLFGGWMIDFLYKKTQSIRKSRVHLLSLGFISASICFCLLAFSSDLYTSIILISLGLGFTFMVNPAIYSLNADLFPSHVATAQGISTSCFALAGIISPSLTGWITQTTGSYESAIIFIAILPILASISALVFCFPAKTRD